MPAKRKKPARRPVGRKTKGPVKRKPAIPDEHTVADKPDVDDEPVVSHHNIWPTNGLRWATDPADPEQVAPLPSRQAMRHIMQQLAQNLRAMTPEHVDFALYLFVRSAARDAKLLGQMDLLQWCDRIKRRAPWSIALADSEVLGLLVAVCSAHRAGFSTSEGPVCLAATAAEELMDQLAKLDGIGYSVHMLTPRVGRVLAGTSLPGFFTAGAILICHGGEKYAVAALRDDGREQVLAVVDKGQQAAGEALAATMEQEDQQEALDRGETMEELGMSIASNAFALPTTPGPERRMRLADDRFVRRPKSGLCT